MDYETEQLKLNASSILHREINEKDIYKGNSKEYFPFTRQQKVHVSRRGQYKAQTATALI